MDISVVATIYLYNCELKAQRTLPRGNYMKFIAIIKESDF